MNPAVIRRRRLAAFALVTLALVGGLLIGMRASREQGGGGAAPSATAPPAPSPLDAAREQVAALPLTQQVGGLLIVSFAGTQPPAYVLDALREGRAAGVILFGGNAPSAAGVRALARRLQRAAGDPPALVSLDQEGGEIRTLAFAPSAVGQAGQRTPAAARAAAAATARALRGVGVNVTLGPVADVAAGTPGSVMASRAYPGGPRAVAASAAAAVGAYERAGVAATLKHFPGLGAATVNTDDASALVGASRTRLVADLLPYRDTRAPLAMVGHARYPALDPHRIASQSRAIVSGLLRGELGFDGVVVTDSLEAEAVGGDVGGAAVRSLSAGADLLLMTGPGSFPLVRDALFARARRSPAFRARVADAAARVLVLRRALRG